VEETHHIQDVGIDHNNTSLDYIDYMHKLYHYRNEFYKLSTELDKTKLMYYELFDIDIDMINLIHGLRDGKHTEIFTISINYMMPVKHSLNLLAEFTSNIKGNLREKHSEIYCNGNYIESKQYNSACDYIINDYIKDAKGVYIINGAKNKFERWEDCIKVFKLYTMNKLSRVNISKKMGWDDGLSKDNHTNGLKKVREHLADAKKLILSAEQGTFPN